jgi:hypothetical protein
VYMELGCWLLHLEFVVVAHSDRGSGDQPWLLVVGACCHSDMATYTVFLHRKWYNKFPVSHA